MPTRASPKSRRDLGDLLLDKSAKALPIWLVAGKDDAHLKELTDAQRTWLEARGWSPKPGAVLLLPDAAAALAGPCLGSAARIGPSSRRCFLVRCRGRSLRRLSLRLALPDPELATLAWLAGSYRFGRYKSENDVKPKRLVLPDGVDRPRVQALAEALDLRPRPHQHSGEPPRSGRARPALRAEIGAEHHYRQRRPCRGFQPALPELPRCSPPSAGRATGRRG